MSLIYCGMWSSPDCRRPTVYVLSLLCMVLPSQPRGACSEVSTPLCVYYLQPRMQLCDAGCCCCCCWGCQLIQQTACTVGPRPGERACKKIMAGSERVWCVVEHVHWHLDMGIRMIKCTDRQTYIYFTISNSCNNKNTSKFTGDLIIKFIALPCD